MRSATSCASGRRIWPVLVLLGIGLSTQLQAQDAPEQRARREAMRRGWLGLSLRVLENSPGRTGIAVIEDVFPDSPADRAGVEEGDTVVRWNGRTDLPEALGDQGVQPGDSVRLRVRRAGRDRDVVVVADQRPRGLAWGPPRRDGDVFLFGPRRPPREMRMRMDSLRVHADSMHRHLRSMLRDSLGPRLREFHRPGRVLLGPDDSRMPLAFDLELGMRAVAGAELAEMNTGLAHYFGTEHGVLVLRVAPETPAARSGLQAGDVVVSINDQAVESVRDLRRAIGASRGRGVVLEVVRKGRRQDVHLRWER